MFDKNIIYLIIRANKVVHDKQNQTKSFQSNKMINA